MGRKALDMAEGVVGQLVAHLGPEKFIIALLNATAHGGAFHECDKVDLDFDSRDLKLNAWHEGLDRLQEVGKWLQTDDEAENIPAFIKSIGNGEAGLSRYDVRLVSELRAEDQTVQQIAVIESLVFEACGYKIRILRKDSKKSTVLLRGSLLWFVDALRTEMATECDIKEIFVFIARSIAEDRVKVTYDEWEFACRVDGHVKRRRIELEEDDRFEINLEDLAELMEERLGAPFEVVCDVIADRVEIDCPRSKFIETLDGYVERVRSVGYVVDSLFDLYGLIVRPPCVRQRHVAGPGFAPISQRQARQRIEALR